MNNFTKEEFVLLEVLERERQSDFKKGMQAGVSIGIGYFPIALTFGLLAKTTGLNLSETVLMSLIVFAGASQYIALSLISLGTGIFEIILTTFIVNIRHFLMSASLAEKCEDDPVPMRLLYAFGLTDETFSIAATKEGKVSSRYLLGLMLIAYSSWVINSGVGHVIGSSLPTVLQESMAIALYAMFIGLLVPSMKKSMKIVYLAGLAACLNSIFLLAELVSTGWGIVIATIISSVLVEWVERLKVKKGRIISG